MAVTVVEVSSDTCDRCGPSVRAYLYARMPSGLSLSYCGSCGTRFLDNLILQGATIADHRDQIGEGSR